MSDGTDTDVKPTLQRNHRAASDEFLISARDLERRFADGGRAALDGVSLEVQKGEFVAVLGPSGCGKSTLLGILGGLDRSYQGTLSIFGRDARAMSDAELARTRGTRIGFVFQAFHLLGHLTAVDNVLAPTLFLRDAVDHQQKRAYRERAEKLLAEVGLGGRGRDFPSQMSGGERQRVAIARAMLMKPEILLCDEPTGNLDLVTGDQIVGIFRKLHAEGLTIVAVTHEEALAVAADRIVRLKAGRVDDAEPPASGEVEA
jgi:putative ABC transport system ATP-binding protein